MGRKRALATLLVLIAIMAPLSLTLMYVHDNPTGITPISSINTGITPIGSDVTVKGVILEIVVILNGRNMQNVRMSDGSGSIELYWTETRLHVNWTIIVRGTAYSNLSLDPVSSVELVLLFP
ncbi:MAG: hypothetical protein C4K48_11000 [Candidatus Thorarchaeota archaeon]|nr:MAG: hypothetical protein C4K48_11000 [Candidatus Thorarchaeota archaeon]